MKLAPDDEEVRSCIVAEAKTSDVVYRALAVGAGLVVGTGGAIARLLGPTVIISYLAVLFPILAGLFVAGVGKALSGNQPIPLGNAPWRAALLVGTAIFSFLGASRLMYVREPQLLYYESVVLTHPKEYGTTFNALVSCGDRWYAFGSRYLTSPGGTSHVDAVVWYSDTGDGWTKHRHDEENQGGRARLHDPGRPSHREFLGASCLDGRTIAYGSDTWSGTGTVQDAEAALWTQEGDVWRREDPNPALGGPGIQRLVGLTRKTLSSPPSGTSPRGEGKRHEFRAFVGHGEGEGGKCLLSTDLKDWTPLGSEAMTGWYVDSVMSDTDRYYALAHRILPDPAQTRESAMFESSDCVSWKRSQVPNAFRYNTVVSSLAKVGRYWYLAGWKLPAHERPSSPLLATGSDPARLTTLNLEKFAGEFSRGIYAIGHHQGRVAALAFDYIVGPNSDSSDSRDDIVMPVQVAPARAVRIPLVGVVRGPGHSNIVLDA